ncbi:MAG: tetratricopeptide repeat protein [Acidobacteria bacterium]|nr:MAG: tetratricopeptide repeat protein [Acidobacteriota bacterium]
MLQFRRVTLMSLILAALLLPGTALADGIVRGKVTDKDGNPVNGVRITLTPSNRAFMTVRTKSKKGKFVVGNLRPSNYRLTAIKEGMRVTHIRINISTPDDESVWKVDTDTPPGAELPQFTVTGLTTVDYDIVMAPTKMEPGEYGTGTRLTDTSAIVQMIEAGRTREAKEEIDRNLEVYPDDPTFNYLAAFCALREGRIDDGLAAVERAIAAPGGLEGARLLKGKLLAEKGDLEAAVAAMREEAATASNPQVVRDTHFEEALVLQKLGRLDEAAASLEKVLELAPERLDVKSVLADIYLKLGKTERARQLMEEVQSSGAEDPTITFNLGADHFNKGEYEKAAELFEKTIQMKPDFADAHRLLGYSRLNLGDLPGAVECLKKFLELAPDSPEAENVRAIVASLSEK